MNIYLYGHDYKYAVEQSAISLMPSHAPRVKPGEPQACERDYIVSSLKATERTAIVETNIYLDGKVFRGLSRKPLGGGDSGQKRDVIISSAAKRSFYNAYVKMTGKRPRWGDLSGVHPASRAALLIASGITKEKAEAMMRSRHMVSASCARMSAECGKAAVEAERAVPEGGVILYAGIPFCPSRCSYCSFYSEDAARSGDLIVEYMDALEREAAYTARLLSSAGRHVHAVYIGGGTPTSVSPAQLGRLLGILRREFKINAEAEFTVEAGRPDTINNDILTVLAENGVNRLSINPQTLNPDALGGIGRKHSVSDFFRAYELAASKNTFLINIDLIAGLPADTSDSFARSLKGILELSPANITIHTLAVKRGSLINELRLEPVSGVAGSLARAGRVLRQNQYEPYYLYRQKYIGDGMENTGWTKSGALCRYNILMMEHRADVIALGAGGVTRIMRGGTPVRVTNQKHARDYVRDFEEILRKKAMAFDEEVEI